MGLNKEFHKKNLNSNRNYLKSYKQRELKEFINNSSSSTALWTSVDPKNKTDSNMSSHIKRMLKASLNSSNPSISAHKNRWNVPATKQIKDLNFGNRMPSTKGTWDSKSIQFNKTQKINIGSHLECMGVLQSKDQNRILENTSHYELNKNLSSNKFRLLMPKKDPCKYSLLQSTIMPKAIPDKTPSYNARLLQKTSVKPQMIRPPGEESNPYYKTQPRDDCWKGQQKEGCLWKNMTQKDIFAKDALKVSSIFPSSTKNCTSKFMKFGFGREERMDAQLMELPSGLKDLEESDLEVEDYEEPNDENTYEELSLEDDNPKCFTKSKIEWFQNKMNNVSFMHKLSSNDKKNSSDDEESPYSRDSHIKINRKNENTSSEKQESK
jgi:hypothetical protein